MYANVVSFNPAFPPCSNKSTSNFVFKFQLFSQLYFRLSIATNFMWLCEIMCNNSEANIFTAYRNPATFIIYLACQPPSYHAQAIFSEKMCMCGSGCVCVAGEILYTTQECAVCRHRSNFSCLQPTDDCITYSNRITSVPIVCLLFVLAWHGCRFIFRHFGLLHSAGGVGFTYH